MCEVTTDNFNSIYKDIENAIIESKFVTLDLEFSALSFSSKLNNSLFDTPECRYHKLKEICDGIIPTQIGISAFTFNPDKNSYLSNTFTFYTFPRVFFNLNPSFIFQSSSVQFLCNYKFDFNKFAYKGISFINRTQENEIKNCLNKRLYLNSDENELEQLVEDTSNEITQFLKNNNVGDTHILKNIPIKYRSSFDIKYLFHNAVRDKFKNEIWTFEKDNQFLIEKISPSQYEYLKNHCKLNQDLLDNMLGFTKVFRLLTKYNKPIIGHNLLMDLMLLYKSCENTLPNSYLIFKKEISKLFPTIFDTKSISFVLKRSIPENKYWLRNSLPHLYTYFKDGYGRHLAFNSPLIELSKPKSSDSFHDAGWDSYSTGYIFIRMAHIMASEKYVNTEYKTFMSAELFAAIDPLKNKLNLIRCSVSHINLDGEDPPSTRPALLVVEFLEKKTMNITKVTGLLSNCGFVEVKPYGRKRAIVAVDNFGSARRILSKFKKHNDFSITTYSAIKHSPVIRAVMWGGVVASGAILMWLATNLKK
ncbi:pre-piRNA 3'-exonuclease trimmer-like [Onthophagus taurus]|uniref:pre-piRNA 3'-exonuclease trimmer-like n=1 Tax=Onthophagus taurus TaxID=166361 RepID=UPI0039BE27A0